MNLNKELAEITRPERAFNEQQQQKHKINERYKRVRTIQLWVQGSVMTCITALFLILFIQTDHVNFPQTQQAILTDELTEITVLLNHVPERRLNLNSPMYIAKRSTTDQNVLDELHTLLTAKNIKVKHTSGQFILSEHSSMHDLLLTYSNGQQLYLKYSPNFLFDPNNEVLYEIPKESIIEFYNVIQSIYSNKKINMKFYALLFFVVLMFLDYHFISKKLHNKDEDGKYKTRPGLMNSVFYLLFYIPFFFGHYWIGTMHLGFILLGLILSFVLGEYYDVKKGIKQPNWKWSIFTLIHVILLLFIIIL